MSRRRLTSGGTRTAPASARNGPSPRVENLSAPMRTSSSTRRRKSDSNRVRGARPSDLARLTSARGAGGPGPSGPAPNRRRIRRVSGECGMGPVQRSARVRGRSAGGDPSAPRRTRKTRSPGRHERESTADPLVWVHPADRPEPGRGVHDPGALAVCARGTRVVLPTRARRRTLFPKRGVPSCGMFVDHDTLMHYGHEIAI